MKVIKTSEFNELFEEYLSFNTPSEDKVLNKVWNILQLKSFGLNVNQDELGLHTNCQNCGSSTNLKL